MPPKSAAQDLVQPQRPRGRPKTEDLAEVEARLIRAARQYFFRDGYGATSMASIARAARASKTTLYSRFPSKASLLRAIVARQIESWDTGLHHTPIDDLDTLEETLLAYGGLMLRAGATPDVVQLNRLLASEAGRFPELAEIADARIRLGIDYVAGRIRVFADRDGVPCRDPERAGELFLMVFIGWSTTLSVRKKAPGPEDQAAWLREVVRVLLASRTAW